MNTDVEERVETVLSEAIGRHGPEASSLMPILQDLNSALGYLSEGTLRRVADELELPPAQVYHVATFYKALSLKPRGRHILKVCMGTACHVRGAPRILDELLRSLKVQAGEVTDDGDFTVETVNCLGACALGPIVVADDHYFSNVDAGGIEQILTTTREGLKDTIDPDDPTVFPLEASCPKCAHSLMDVGECLDGRPSVCLAAVRGSCKGNLRLSSLYGSSARKTSLDDAESSRLQVACPHCDSVLVGTTPCPECGGAMIPMIVAAGGLLQICTQVDCRGRLLDIVVTPDSTRPRSKRNNAASQAAAKPVASGKSKTGGMR